MHTQARVHTRVMRVGSGELQGKAHLPAQPSSHNPAPRSQLRHLQVCAESQHRPESLQEKSCLWRGLVNCVLDVLGHFISLQSKGRIRTLCTRPSSFSFSGEMETACPWAGGMGTSLGHTYRNTHPRLLSVLLARITGARSGNIHCELGTASWHLNRDPKSCFSQAAALL